MKKKIPDSYQITEEDSNGAWKIFASKNDYIALSEYRLGLVNAFIEARYLHQKSGAWPTLGEVYEHWRREEEKRQEEREARELKFQKFKALWDESHRR